MPVSLFRPSSKLTPRARCCALIPESNFQSSFPVAASRAMTFSVACIGIEDPPNNQRIRLNYAFFAGVVGPLHLELRYILAVDLGQWRVVLTLHLPTIDRPIDVGPPRLSKGLSGGRGQHPRQKERGH